MTGGNAGIGFATAQQLARRGAHVVIACRDAERARAAVQRIAATTQPLFPPAVLPAARPKDAAAAAAAATSAAGPGSGSVQVEAMPLDLGRLSSVRDFAEQWRRRGLPLHLLVCNAGLMGPPARLETADGLEMQFQVGPRGSCGVRTAPLTPSCFSPRTHVPVWTRHPATSRAVRAARSTFCPTGCWPTSCSRQSAGDGQPRPQQQLQSALQPPLHAAATTAT